jgi:hypothetical protein
MAYQTGTATGTADLLDKLNTFAVANGWTLNRRDAASLSISKSGIYQNLWENGSKILLRMATGYDGGAAWDAQPGAATWKQVSWGMSGSFSAYHFFAAGNYIYIVVEVDPGVFKHLAFGEIHKCGAYTGGEFSATVILDNENGTVSIRPHGLFGCQDDGANFVYVNHVNGLRVVGLDAQPDWRPLNGNTAVPEYVVKSSEFYFSGSNGTDNGHYRDWFVNSPNTETQQTILIPIHLYVERGSSLFSPAGYIDDLRLVNMTNINPGDSRIIGANEWLCFPVWQKGVNPSYNYGYAYKKIP